MKYAVLSDLHLGQNNKDGSGYLSLFSSTAPSDKMNKLKKVLNDFGNNVNLIVTGDFLDLSLATMNDCVSDLNYFLSSLSNVFKLTYVIGNHDHHLFLKHSEQKYCDEYLKRGLLPLQGSVYESTVISGEWSELWSNYLQKLLNRNIDVYLVYPSLILTLGNTRCYFQHGHFVDNFYTKFSDILRPYLQNVSIEKSVATVNTPLIEFLYWSAGEMGCRMGANGLLEKVYSNYEKGEIESLKQVFLNSIRALFPDGLLKWVPDSWERWIMKKLVIKIVEQLAQDKKIGLQSIDRYEPSQDTRNKIKLWYDQIFKDEIETIIFSGHTHVPDMFSFSDNLHLINCGGALIEPEHPNPQMSVCLLEEISGRLTIEMVNI